MVSFLARDQSGSENVTFRKHEFIAVGNVVKINKCKLMQHNNRKQIGGLNESNI
jgi:hypothetical protein